MLKILIVEDSQEKLRRVASALCEVPGCDISSVDSAHNSVEAKSHLRGTAYDLVVLDIALPERLDKTPSPEGGIALLEEILDRDIYKQPREVVGLTAFEEVFDKAAHRFGEDLWQVVLYDPSSDSWRELLKRKVKHILMTKHAGKKFEHDLDLCVLTAVHDPELAAVLRLPWNWEDHDVEGDSIPYKKGYYKKQTGTGTVMAAAAPRMGMPAASVLASKMIQHFRPRYIGMVGIAAGVRGMCELGDVLAVDPSWDWGSGKWALEKTGAKFLPAPHHLGLYSFIRGQLSKMSQDHALWDKLRHDWQGPKPNTTLQLRLGPVASGASVLAIAEQSESIKQQHRKLLGIDMEAYGVFAAAEDSPLPQPKAMVFKGVSDFADVEKNDTYQAYAAYASANALRVLVETYL